MSPSAPERACLYQRVLAILFSNTASAKLVWRGRPRPRPNGHPEFTFTLLW